MSAAWPNSPRAGAANRTRRSARIEAADNTDFDTYLARYLAD